MLPSSRAKKEKAQNYLARAALNFRRSKSITQEEWLAMGGEVRKKNEDLKCELDILADRRSMG
jgi:hypothetical protein